MIKKTSGIGGARGAGWPINWKPRMLMGPNDGKGGSGGAGGDPPDDGDPDDKPMSKKDVMSLLATEVGKGVNKAMTDHRKRITDDITKSFDEKLGKLGEQLGELSTKLAAPPQPQPGAGADPGAHKGGAPGQPAPEVLAELKQLREKTATLEKKSKDAEEARVAAENKARTTAERNALSEALVAKGAKKTMIGPAVAFLYTEGQRVRTLDDGKRVFKNDEGEDMPLEEGVAEWLKTEAGQEYMPPRSAAGSGSTQSKGTGGGAANGAMSDTDFVKKIGL